MNRRDCACWSSSGPSWRGRGNSDFSPGDTGQGLAVARIRQRTGGRGDALLDRGFGKPRTDQPVTLDEMDGALADQGRAVLSAMASGKLTPSETATMLQALSAQVRIVEAEDLVEALKIN